MKRPIRYESLEPGKIYMTNPQELDVAVLYREPKSGELGMVHSGSLVIFLELKLDPPRLPKRIWYKVIHGDTVGWITMTDLYEIEQES